MILYGFIRDHHHSIGKSHEIMVVHTIYLRAAARGASNLLRIKKPKTRLGYLTQLNDGTTTMHYLPCGPGKLAVTGETANVSLEALITTIKQGAGTIQIYRENRTHELRELYSPRSGPHRPSYESVFSKLTDPELDQVKSIFGRRKFGNSNTPH